MDSTIKNTTTDIPIISSESRGLTKEIQAKVIHNNLKFSIETTTKTIINMENIPLSEDEYKIILHFKNGGLLNQLTVNQLKLLLKFYHFTEQDLIEVKGNHEFFEYLNKTKIRPFFMLPEAVKRDIIIAKKAFVAGDSAFIKYIPKELQTQEICDKAFQCIASNFVYFDDKFKTLDMCSKYLKNLFEIDFALIPEKFRPKLEQAFINRIKECSIITVSGVELLPINILKENVDIVRKSCLDNGKNLPKLNPCFATKEFLCELAKKAITLIPKQYLDIELVLLAIEHSGFYSDSRCGSREDQLQIIDEYFIEHQEQIQQAVWQRFATNESKRNRCPFYLLKYIPNKLLVDKYLTYLKQNEAHYQYFPENIKSNIKLITYLLEDWIKQPYFCSYETEMILQYKNSSAIFEQVLPDDFFTQKSQLEDIKLVSKKNTFLEGIPNECKTLDMWIYLCINIDREYVKKIPESMVSEELLMQLIDEYVQDASRFDLDFTEFLFSHKLFNSNMQEKIFVHTLKCSARCSRVFMKILRSSSMPQRFKDDVFKNIMQGNIGYPQSNITELYAKTNPLVSQIPAKFATEFLSSLYKFNGFNRLKSSQLIDELKTYITEKQIEKLPLDTTENIFTNAQVLGGRTMRVNINENTAIFYKFRKPSESLSDFIKEGHFLEFLAKNNAGKQVKQKLKSDIPLLKKMVSIPLDKLPECVLTCEDGLDIYLDENNIKYVDVLVFSGSIDYLQYAHKPDINNLENPFIKPEQGLLTATHDLGVFMSQGIYHTTTLPLFHYEIDDRKWSVLNMILRGLPATTIRGIKNGHFFLNQNIFSMTGKLEAWDSTATERPDYGYSGLRDLADYEFYGEIDSIRTRADSEACLFESIKQKTYAANTICECLTAIILLYARLHKFSADYHYTNDNCRANTSKFIENIFKSFLTGILQDETINLQKFMQLTDEDYQQWLDRATTELLYWTAQQPETKGENASKEENEDCFSAHVNKKQLPADLFDDTTVLKYIKYPKYFTTTEGNKKHNNLGMYNGTFPLLALTKFMILFNTRLNEQ